MPIIYALVSKGSYVLVEMMAKTGNMSAIARKILLKVAHKEGKMSYTYDNYAFHYVVSGYLCFMCLTDYNFSQTVAFSFLLRAQRRFIDRYGQTLENINSYQYQDFGLLLKEMMADYSILSPERLERAKDDLRGTKVPVAQNIDRLLQRHEKSELLVDQVEKTPFVDDSLRSAQRHNPTMKKAPWYKNMLIWLIVIMVLLVIGIVCILVGCGGFTFKNCR
ncbi:vesicle-associated membrane protein 7D [Monocercomonoides exilis]|uniref:vesicle-associated membrane protein 7D n=1 Tax=Monocercomonoides exilis TaxID=2049356 RepID=UPI00355A9087|nr:vesicle-associated membrane protein 7D [Monocercomonoides exilis]|eukprot:MONOS_10971.1-p1 / transcript=MONOS_10971.1 / gene=MONOS_10971 / organism=Monocercomonoides_exilis_PA203 / gene_product= vesicle-associated membrane protein 7D / transcript_product= vesicle-associated membrane protein 7D / location=Mono_scaffold00523:23396-24270(+) / protein_length=220 / sequence_SO=supercontig / SO=protein_coding / is_pseudo=false